jgi:hypothetical protein
MSILKYFLVGAAVGLLLLWIFPDESLQLAYWLGLESPEERIDYHERTEPFKPNVHVETGFIKKTTTMTIEQEPPAFMGFACTNASVTGVCIWLIKYSYSVEYIDGQPPEYVEPIVTAVIDSFYTTHTLSNCSSVKIDLDLRREEIHEFFVSRKFMDTIRVEPEPARISEEVLNSFYTRTRLYGSTD